MLIVVLSIIYIQIIIIIIIITLWLIVMRVILKYLNQVIYYNMINKYIKIILKNIMNLLHIIVKKQKN